MRYVPPGHHKSVAAFREHLRSIDPALDCDPELRGADGPLGRPLELGDRVIGNRFCAQPMEGWDSTAEGMPSELTKRRWHRFGRSGAKLVWGGEAFAVAEDGRANPRQLYMNPSADVAAGLASLLCEIRTGHREIGEDPDEPVIGLQLTHSGRYSWPRDRAEPRIAYHHPLLDEMFAVPETPAILSDGELEAIGARFVELARLAWQAGFHFVDVKCCHGYLLHELLGAKARSGSYGGSFENRTRLLRRIVAGIRSACPGLEVAVRVSLADVCPYAADPDSGIGVPRGLEDLPLEHGFGIDPEDPREFDLTEPYRFLALLQELGIRLVNISLGTPYTSPHLQRPAAYPPSDGYQPPEDPLTSVAKHLGVVRAAKRAFPDLILVGSGYSYLAEYLPHVAQHELGKGHVDFVGLGRMLLAYPELPQHVLRGVELERSRICRTISDCTTAPRHGIVSGCFPLDPHYRSLPEAEELHAIKQGGER